MSSPFQLCILRLSAIGDVCHAAAMVNAILAIRPDIKITWVVGKIEYQLLKFIPDVEFVVYDKKAGKQARKEVKKAVENTNFDALFIMQLALRANWLSTVIKAKRRIGFDYDRSKEGHSIFTNESVAPHANAHVLEGFMDFAETLGIPPLTTPSWNFQIPQDDLDWVAAELPDNYAVISPAASKEERNWLPERYAQTADYLTAQGVPVVLCGGPGDLDMRTSSAILKHTQNIAFNLVGTTSLIRLLAVLKQAKLVIAPDTGPAHMATTQGTPVIGLYAHSNPLRTGPYNSLSTTASVYEACVQKQFGKPWQELPWGKRAKGESLMNDISVQEVQKYIQKILKIS